MTDSKYKVGVVGAGLVGEALINILEERNFPMKELRVMATSTRRQSLAGKERDVIETCEKAFDGLNIALFAGTEGESGAAILYGRGAAQKGIFVVDNGSDFRMEKNVPLIIPEVNSEAMRKHQGIIANPNCSTIQMVAALAPLHRHAGIRRIVVSTYQSVSGTGRDGIRALEQQREALIRGARAGLGPYPYPILNNCIPEIGSLKDPDRFPGFFSEEIKMIEETRKILDEPELPVTATCVRVPVRMSHSEAINVEFKKPLSREKAVEILKASEGIEVEDEPEKSGYPIPARTAGSDAVYVGRIRKDPSNASALDIWCVADNIRKGAALNTVQIAEKAIEMGLI